MFKKTCCCICLSTNKRTVNIYRTDLLYFYEQLANYKVRDSECWMCYICQTRLQQCHRLQQLAVQTRGLVDGLCENKADIDIGAIGSLLELSIFKKKNISTTHPILDNIKEEPDIKTEQYDEGGIIEEQTVENTNGEDYSPVIEFEDDDVSDSNDVCKQESLSDCIDAWQGSKELELKLVKSSQSVIDKYARQSPPTQHTTTEEHVVDKGKCAGEQSVGNEDKKADIDIGAIGSLLELSISKKKNISTTHPTPDNIKEEPDIKTEQYDESGIIEEQTVENTNGADYSPMIEFEDDDVSDSDDVCKQESLSDCIDAWQGSRVLELKLVKLSQSVIDKYVRRSPPTQHTTTEEHVGDKGKCAGEQSVENEDKKAQYKSHKDQFICDVCLKMFSTKGNLVAHIRIHTGENKFTCDIFDKKLSTKSILKTHMRIHTGEKPFNCTICQKKFGSKYQLQDHLLTHTDDTPYTCDICKKKFTFRSSLERHLLVHTGEKHYNCDICQKKFGRKSTLQEHLLIHTGEKPYNCDICKKKFTFHSSLERHFVIHTGEKPFNCNVCQKKFGRKYILQKHLLTHTGDKPYNCDICQKKFKRRYSLKRHLVIHSGEKPFNCTICQKKFGSKYQLQDHLLTHTDDTPYTCDICKKKFTFRSSLERHLLIHTGEKHYNCDICQKKFGRKSTLQEHLLVHTGEKPYNCDICKKKFTLRRNLKRHLVIHTGEKPYYNCSICHKNFSQSKSLKSHMLIHARVNRSNE